MDEPVNGPSVPGRHEVGGAGPNSLRVVDQFRYCQRGLEGGRELLADI